MARYRKPVEGKQQWSETTEEHKCPLFRWQETEQAPEWLSWIEMSGSSWCRKGETCILLPKEKPAWLTQVIWDETIRCLLRTTPRLCAVSDAVIWMLETELRLRPQLSCPRIELAEIKSEAESSPRPSQDETEIHLILFEAKSLLQPVGFVCLFCHWLASFFLEVRKENFTRVKLAK